MLLARLKEETQEHHRKIEAELSLMQPEFSLTDYRHLLRRFYGFYLPWERAVSEVSPNLLARRRKTWKLVDDLEYLGCSREQISRIPHCDALPPLDTYERILGSMYVLEGATLGGQILAPYFEKKFNLADDGAEFFSGYGRRTATMWKEFRAMIEREAVGSHDEIVTSAVATFQSMRVWMCPERVI
ncbi:MAG TPA: biliverdin-producing heme oxygenase [Bryobacteraceae bacterium]|nr:biliverdin-producing heme oxygenase [Bryobacteraceae bacterium]